MSFLRGLFCLIVSCLISSCLHYGSMILPPDRMSYNRSLLESDNQQLLLNLVRLRYSDIPYFLGVNNVVAQFQYEHDLNVSISSNSYFPPPPSIFGLAQDTVRLAENPTITYTPLQGSDYVHKLLTPIDLAAVHMLIRAGWGVNEIFRLFFQRMGPLDNAILSDRTTSSHAPEYKLFHRFGLFLHDLQYNGHLSVGDGKVNNNYVIKIKIQHFDTLTAKQRAYAKRYGLTPDSPELILCATPMQGKNIWLVQTRTILGLFYYLSKSIEIPQANIDQKRAPITYTKDGKIFDWQKLLVGELQIFSTKRKPQNAYISVQYKDYWYYISDQDFNSKETLNILSIIMGIYQGDIKSVLPVFTVS